MINEEPLTVNGHNANGERETSQVPPSPDLRKREVSQVPPSPNLLRREREASQVPPSPDLRKRAEESEIRQRQTALKQIADPEEEDVHTLVSPVATTSKKSPQKTFEQFVDEDKKKESRHKTDSVGGSSAKAEVVNKPEKVWNMLVQWKWHIAAIGFILGLTVLLFLNYPTKTDVNAVKNETIRPWRSSRNFFYNKVKSLREEFGAQKQETWAQVVAAVNSTLSDHEPKQPAAIVLLLPPGVTRQFSTCFAKVLAEAVNNAHVHRNSSKTVSAVKEMDPEYFARSPSVTHIHDELKTYLSQDKAVIFYDVDRIQREEHLLIFHGFCDSSQAYDKRATYIFAVSVPQEAMEMFEWTHKNGEEIALYILNSAWENTLSEDKRPAVLSRILANIVLINGGDSCK